MTRPTIQPLTSIRFFAALYVVLYHTLTELVRGKDDPTAVNGDFLGLGYISVSFFLFSPDSFWHGYIWKRTKDSRSGNSGLHALHASIHCSYLLWCGTRRTGFLPVYAESDFMQR